jgi:type II secretory pathway component GspD/PulD (secretin)
LRIKNEETVIMGGLISKQRTVNKSKIPFFSSIPFIGKLFEQQNVDDPENKEMVVFVTPRIINESLDSHQEPVEPDLLKQEKKEDYTEIVKKIRKRLSYSE